MQNTIAALNQAKLVWGGLGNTHKDVITPRIVTAPGNIKVAFFTLVIDECWKWGNGLYTKKLKFTLPGSLYLDACTCGRCVMLFFN
jgi:hypothetical protein